MNHYKKIASVIATVIVVGIFIHTPVMVMLSSNWPVIGVVSKAWKEVLMVIGLALLLVGLMRYKMLKKVTSIRMIRLCLYYIALHLFVALVIGGVSTAVIAGLLIDLRFVLLFLLVYLLAASYSEASKRMIQIFVCGMIMVGVVALVQSFLPKDVLEYIGYSKHTILPYLLVDGNEQFVRYNSTLRGPNPLGAVSVIGITIGSAALLWRARFFHRYNRLVFSTLLAMSGIGLWLSYSRGAILAASVSVILVFLVRFRDLVSWRKLAVGGVVLIFAVGALIISLRNIEFVSNIVFHDNLQNGRGAVTNQAHLSSLLHAASNVSMRPFGYGIGSSGTASLYGTAPLIIENQYFMIAHEVGVFGLMIFLLILSTALQRLWVYRREWLSLAVFASGVGLSITALLLPVWSDDATSIIWWGMAGLVLGAKDVKLKQLFLQTSPVAELEQTNSSRSKQRPHIAK